jgi:UDP-GlcNAc:undecaprenyl-phosphate GlcNAc-1-phosphate transferase
VLDHPDNARKLHKRATPQVGGIAIVVGLLVWGIAASLFGLMPDPGLTSAVFLCGAGVALVGFADDQSEVSPVARLAFLLVFVVVAFVFDKDLLVPQINSLIFSAIAIPVWAYFLLVVVAALGVVNAVNMADGQDGVAAGMFAIWTACLAYLSTGESRNIAAVLHVLCLVFLVFNLRPRGKIFLGDCGSYGITFIIGMMTVLAHARGHVVIETVLVWFYIPVVDCLRLLITRTSRGNSPFRADRDHFHHRLEDRLGKYRGLACYLVTVGLSSAVSTIFPHWAPGCLCVLTGFYFAFALTHSDVVVERQTAKAAPVKGNVVSIAGDRRGAA